MGGPVGSGMVLFKPEYFGEDKKRVDAQPRFPIEPGKPQFLLQETAFLDSTLILPHDGVA